MEVIISPEAMADIAEIGDYISRDNPERAITFCEELVSVCAMLPRRAGLYEHAPGTVAE